MIHFSNTRPVPGARVPNQRNGLTLVGHWMTRAALVVNRRRIGRLVAQHPVQPYRQLACRCHLGHAFRLLVAAMLILSAKLFVVAAGRLRGFDQQRTQKYISLFRNRSQPALAAGTSGKRFGLAAKGTKKRG